MIIKVSVPESTIKEFPTKKGGTCYKISLAKSYRDKNGDWVNSDVFLTKDAYDALKENKPDVIYHFSGRNNLETI